VRLERRPDDVPERRNREPDDENEEREHSGSHAPTVACSSSDDIGHAVDGFGRRHLVSPSANRRLDSISNARDPTRAGAACGLSAAVDETVVVAQHRR
jgi:hypothetical protein